MSETNRTGKTESNGDEKETKARQVYDSLEAAKAAPSENEREAVFECLKDDKTIGFVWAARQGGTAIAVLTAARRDHYSARLAEPKGNGPITKERVKAKLAELTDEELTEMGLTRKKGKK
jgi:hypothetical protein